MYTPGPWKCEPIGDIFGEYKITQFGVPPQELDQEGAANARLIELAPALYQALKNLLEPPGASEYAAAVDEGFRIVEKVEG